jgi:glycosyltransferase involved in cell wall biosynthesis
MVERVEEEYRVANRIRVSSEWAKASLVSGGVPARKIDVLQQSIDLMRFRPSQSTALSNEGPLHLCFVGSLDLRKGFPYLLAAMRMIGSNRVQLEIVGATVDRCSARLFSRECVGLDVRAAAGNPSPAYERAELFVLPTLEDGSPFAVAEAMACGLPVIVTDECGSAEWVEEGVNGWIAKAGSIDSLAEKLAEAIRNRAKLGMMGQRARRDTETRAGTEPVEQMASWMLSTVMEH